MRQDKYHPAIRLWLIAAALLGGIGGTLWLVKAWPVAASMSRYDLVPNIVMRAIYVGWAAGAGIVGLTGVFVASRQRAVWIPVTRAMGLAGAGGILLDSLEVAVPPWTIPGVLLLIAAGLLYSLHQLVLQPQQVSAMVVLGQGIVGVSLGVHILVALSFFAIGLIVAIWWWVLMNVFWYGMLALALRVRYRVPWLVPAIPLLTFFVMTRLVTLGITIFGWTP